MTSNYRVYVAQQQSLSSDVRRLQTRGDRLGPQMQKYAPTPPAELEPERHRVFDLGIERVIFKG